MSGWQQIFTEFPWLQTLLDILCVTIPLAILFAFSGLFFISGIAKILAIVKKRSAFDKCSRQLALLGLIFGWTLLIASRVWLYYTPERHAPGTLENFMFELSWMLLSMGVLLSSIYYTLWRILKNMPVLHVTIGMISAVQNCLALICILFSVRLYAVITNPQKAGMEFFPLDWTAPLWAAVCLTAPLLFAAAGAFGAAWLPLRRSKDDFGRDYYNTMLPWVIHWARNSWLIIWLLLFCSSGIQIWQAKEVFGAQDAIWHCSLLLFWLIPLLLWIMAGRYKIALRGKWLDYLALLWAIAFMLPYFLEITLADPGLDMIFYSLIK